MKLLLGTPAALHPARAVSACVWVLALRVADRALAYVLVRLGLRLRRLLPRASLEEGHGRCVQPCAPSFLLVGVLLVAICVAPLPGSPSWRRSMSCLCLRLEPGYRAQYVLDCFASVPPAPTGLGRVDALGSLVRFGFLRGASWMFRCVLSWSQRGRIAAGAVLFLPYFPSAVAALSPSPSYSSCCPYAERTFHGSHGGDDRSQMAHWVGLAAWEGGVRRCALRVSGWVRAHRSWSWLAQLDAALALTASPPLRYARAFLAHAFLPHGSPSSSRSAIERGSNEN